MNQYQTQLYADLIRLTQEHDDFSHRDFVRDDGTTVRIFNYRLGSFSAFQLPNALNCRGTMFLVNADGTPAALLALPMEKFFGNEENPFTMKLDFSPANIKYVANKLDGSLISTYCLDGLRLKSKNSIQSKEVATATALLATPDYAPLKRFLEDITEAGYTVDLEYTGPGNRIVLAYETERLSVLSLRRRSDGQSFLLSEVCTQAQYALLRDFEVELFDVADLALMMATLDTRDRFEGVVVCLANGQRVKVKSLRYVLLHHARDSVSVTEGIKDEKKLFACVVYEQADDLKSIFAGQPEVVNAITEVEQVVVPQFNAMVEAVEAFVASHQHLDKKAFAQAGQAVNDGFFQLKMMKYLGREVDYRGFAVRNANLFQRTAA